MSLNCCSWRFFFGKIQGEISTLVPLVPIFFMKKQEEKFPGFPSSRDRNFWSYPRIMDGWWPTLSGSEQKCLDFVLRKTWGFQKDRDRISLSQVQKGTGLARNTVINSLRELESKSFIFSDKSPAKTTYYFLVQDLHQESSKSEPLGSSTTEHTIEKEKNNTNSQNSHNSFLLRSPLEKQSVQDRLIYYLEDTRGTPTVYWKKQVSAVNEMMIAGYSEDSIVKAIDWLKKDPFWSKRSFDMKTVSNQIEKIQGSIKAERLRTAWERGE